MYEHLVGAVKNFILGEGEGVGIAKFPLLEAVAKVMLDDVIKSINEGRCPFCGKTFTKDGKLKAHLKLAHKKEIGKIAEQTVEVYHNLRKKLRIKKKRVGWSKVVMVYELCPDNDTMPCFSFHTATALATFMKRNPDLAMKLLSGGGGE